MNKRLPSGRWIGVLVLAGLAPAAWAEDAARMFDSLFGQEVKRVKATRGYEDDQKLAGDLLGVAEKRKQDTALVEVVCRTAWDLARKTPAGFPTAVKAMELLAECIPAKAPECRGEILSVRRRQYGAARGAERTCAAEALIQALQAVAEDKIQAKDYTEALKLLRQAAAMAGAMRLPVLAELQAKVRKVAAWELARRQIVQMEARLKADPKDGFARRRIIELYLVELDDPAGAARFVDEESDERLKTYIPLAAKDAQDLADQACLELAQWYLSLADKATTHGKITVLVRARTYYQSFLAKHEKTDLSRTKASLALEKIEAELSRLDPTPEVAAKWIDVLKLVDPGKHAVAGKWTRSGSKVGTQQAARQSRIGIPVAPKGDYELKVQFVRRQGDNDVNMILPAGKTSVMLMLSNDHGKASGLSNVDGKYCEANETRTSGKLSNGKLYLIHVTVKTKDDQAEIHATMDGQKLVDWSGPLSRLSNSRYWQLPNPQILGLGLDTGNTGYFQSAQLRMLSGKAEAAPFSLRSQTDPDDERDRRRRWWEEQRDRWDRSRRDWRRRPGGPRR